MVLTNALVLYLGRSTQQREEVLAANWTYSLQPLSNQIEFTIAVIHRYYKRKINNSITVIFHPKLSTKLLIIRTLYTQGVEIISSYKTTADLLS